MEYESNDYPITQMLEDALIDSYERGVLDKVNEFNSSPYSVRHSDKQVEELVIELNKQWIEVVGREVQIAGLMQTYVNDPETGEPTSEINEKRYIKHDEASIGEFGLQALDEPVIVDGEIIDTIKRYKIVLAFYYEIESEDEDNEDDIKFVYGFALPSEISFIAETMTVDQSIAYVHFYYKEIARAITDIIDRIDDNEEDFTIELKDVSLDLNSIDANEAAEALSIYISEFLHYDSGVPYLANFDGDGVIENESGDEDACTFHGMALVRPYYIYVAKLNDDDQYQFYLNMSIVNSVESEPEQHIRIPLSSVTSLKSLRRQFNARN